MSNRKPWDNKQKAAVCAALDVLYWKLPAAQADWLRTSGLAEIEDALGEKLRFSLDREEFQY